MWLTERNAPLSARAIHSKPACRRPIGCARGGRPGDPSKCDRKELKPAATEGSLPPVMPQGNLVEVLGREVRQGSPGELMVETSPSRQRRPPCKTNKENSDEAADAAALTYLLTGLSEATWEPMSALIQPDGSIARSINPIFGSYFIENNEGQLLTCAETLSQRKKKN